MRVRLVRDTSVHLPVLGRDFPIYLRDESGTPQLSVHLCVSDAQHWRMDEELSEPGPTRDRHGARQI
jgi:hypothetical protein